MHKYEFHLGKDKVFNVYLDKEELNVGEAVVVGSTVYQVVATAKSDATKCAVKKISEKLYVGMLSEW